MDKIHTFGNKCFTATESGEESVSNAAVVGAAERKNPRPRKKTERVNLRFKRVRIQIVNAANVTVAESDESIKITVSPVPPTVSGK
jgi:type VI protein secretion system component Hcp